MEVVTTKYLYLLAIYIILLNHQIAIATENKDNVLFPENLFSHKGKTSDLIKKVCDQTPNKDLCLEVLLSEPTSEHATLQDLAMISLKVAASNATGILTDVKMMIDDPDLDPGIQQGLADCKETLLDAEGQLEDTVAAILGNSKRDVQLWLQAALAAIDTCDASIPGDDDVLSKRSVAFRQLCNIAVAVSKILAKDGA
ncbi:pectinesterase inhibitor-like [Cicer arietinum]|uniref:Pectinesterase inhibitor-like n=1 Tax=Cicer arietinum TaxID=3827 RepID=A0A1S2YNG0_CICAR|nr:pectinesterase inhibitor-like [Cicer arietinum]